MLRQFKKLRISTELLLAERQGRKIIWVLQEEVGERRQPMSGAHRLRARDSTTHAKQRRNRLLMKRRPLGPCSHPLIALAGGSSYLSTAGATRAIRSADKA